jgi:hypothetical protein
MVRDLEVTSQLFEQRVVLNVCIHNQYAIRPAMMFAKEKPVTAQYHGMSVQ